MLAITGGLTLWYVSSVTNMRYGKYRLFAEVESLGKTLIQVKRMFSCPKTGVLLRLYDLKIINVFFMISLTRKVISLCNPYLRGIPFFMNWTSSTLPHCLNVPLSSLLVFNIS